MLPASHETRAVDHTSSPIPEGATESLQITGVVFVICPMDRDESGYCSGKTFPRRGTLTLINWLLDCHETWVFQ